MLKVSNNKGAALLLVIMITAVMSSIMMIMLSQNQFQAKLSNLIKANTNARLAAQDLQSVLLFEMLSSGAYLIGTKQSKTIDNLKGMPFKFEDATVTILDKSGLISLRPLNERGLINLLRAFNADRTASRVILNRLEDWSDEDGLSKFDQGERIYGMPYLPPNQGLTSLAELSYIFKGYESLLEKVKPYLVLHTPSETNNSIMPAELFERLYPNQRQSDIIAGSEFQNVGAEAAISYASGRFQIQITLDTEIVNITRSFELSKGLGTSKPFYVSNEKY